MDTFPKSTEHWSLRYSVYKDLPVDATYICPDVYFLTDDGLHPVSIYIGKRQGISVVLPTGKFYNIGNRDSLVDRNFTSTIGGYTLIDVANADLPKLIQHQQGLADQYTRYLSSAHKRIKALQSVQTDHPEIFI